MMRAEKRIIPDDGAEASPCTLLDDLVSLRADQPISSLCGAGLDT
jgi:hypothetical protein